MNGSRGNRDFRSRAGGILEVLVVVATLALLALLLLQSISRAKTRATRITCVSHLKLVGLAARIWSNDHGNAFPWDTPMSSNGVKEIALSGNVAALLGSRDP
jgi:competence protein ComGC